MITPALTLIHPHAHPPLNPLLALHLREPRQRPRKREPLLVAAEDRAGFQLRHGEAQVVHEAAHGVGEVLDVGFVFVGGRWGFLRVVLGVVLGRDGIFEVVGGEEEVGERDAGCEYEFCL